MAGRSGNRNSSLRPKPAYHAEQLKARTVKLLCLSPLVLVAAVGWVVTRPSQLDRYDFLGNRAPTRVLVQGPGSWGPSETRIYTWKAPMKQVATEAGAELAKMGLKRRPQLELTPGTVVWTSELINGGPCGVGADVWVEFHAGRVLPPSSPQETNNDPDYTTVCIDTSLDESWLNVVRYTLFSQ